MRHGKHLYFFLIEMRSLLGSATFWLLTVLGNSLICSSGVVFFLLEHGKNPGVQHFLDAIWWAFTTATTTGYGSITPVTAWGKVLSIFTMLGGLAIFAMYTALFAETILTSKRVFHEYRKQKN
jgi:voltage-gated potassium channel